MPRAAKSQRPRLGTKTKPNELAADWWEAERLLRLRALQQRRLIEQIDIESALKEYPK